MTETLSDIEYIFGSIFALSNRLQRLGDKLNDYMTMKQWLMIAAISKSESQALTIGETAALIGTSHQNIKKMAVILQKQGFLALTRHPSDARATVISLTDYCREYFARRSDTETSFLEAVFHSFDSEAISGLHQGLRLLEQNIERMEDLAGRSAEEAEENICSGL